MVVFCLNRSFNIPFRHLGGIKHGRTLLLRSNRGSAPRAFHRFFMPSSSVYWDPSEESDLISSQKPVAIICLLRAENTWARGADGTVEADCSRSVRIACWTAGRLWPSALCRPCTGPSAPGDQAPSLCSCSVDVCSFVSMRPSVP